MTLMAANQLQIDLLAPDGGRQPVQEVLTLPQSSDEPFSDTRKKALAKLSRAILKDTTLRADPASVAVGYWLRRSNIERLATHFERRKEFAADTVLVPVGRVFHVAPGNVDTVFLYSWVLSYLCGNQNIVRVSGERSEILNRLLAVLCNLMEEDAELANGNSIRDI